MSAPGSSPRASVPSRASIVSAVTISAAASSGIASLTAPLARRTPTDQHAAPDGLVMPGIGNDEDRAPRGERHVLGARPEQFGIAAIGIELAEDRKIAN
jgi:hypothetical protein